MMCSYLTSRSTGAFRWRRWLFPVAAVISLSLANGSRAAEAMRSFDVPAQDAAVSLKIFAEQCGREIVYSPEAVRGTRTNAVKGEFSAREALDRMLGATELVATQTRGGVFTIKRVERPNVEGPAPRRQSDRPDLEEKTIVLSPFEVLEDKHGYYATTTMSGTRFNTKLEDLASSITVVTKEQMQDLALLDLNDIFLYVGNTEGTGTYTDFTIAGSQVSDNTMTNPLSANRVRGIGPANVSLGNFETSNRVPLDPIMNDGVEVSRGPNANVFGLGNASGTVNQVPATANLSRNRTEVGFRADSYDGWRTSLDVNRVLWSKTLAARLSAVRQYEGYVRKPSGTNTRRLNGMLRFRPFKSTTLTASYSYYDNQGNRPNSSPPRDAVSYWVERGSPTWDPITQTIHVSGATLGPFPTAAGIPNYFTGTFQGFDRFQLFIDRSGVAYWSTNSSVSGNSPTPVGNQPVRLLATVSQPVQAGQPLFSTTPSIRDRRLYDWTSINYAAPNFHHDTTHTSSIALNQQVFTSPLQSLHAQLAWLREDSEKLEQFYMGKPGNIGATGFLQVDPNERLIDGSPNPFFLRPFIAQVEPITYQVPLRWDTYRVQLAYSVNAAASQSGWWRLLGRHDLSPYYEYKDRIQRRFGFREVIADDHPWIAPGELRGVQQQGPSPNVDRGNFRFYVGDAKDYNFDYAPSRFDYGRYTFVWGNAATGQFNREPALLDWAAADHNSAEHNVLKTKGGVIQSHLLGGRIVTTFGLREDEIYTRLGRGGNGVFLADGMHFNYEVMNQFLPEWTLNSGRTKQSGVVVKPLRDFNRIEALARSPGFAGFVGNLLRGFAVTYNKSDSFLPEGPAHGALRNTLPNPKGLGRDYGLLFNLWEDKVVLRINRYETKQISSRAGDAEAFVNRTLRLEGLNDRDPWNLWRNATAWIGAENPSWTAAQVQAEVKSRTGIGTDDFQEFLRLPTSETLDLTAKGTEVELNINPTRWWTLQFNGAETKAINSNLSPGITQYLAARLPVWTKLVDTRTNTLWWNTTYGANSPSAYYTAQVATGLNLFKTLEGKARPEMSRYSGRLSTNLRLDGVTDHRWLKHFNVGGALRWQDRAAIGYYGVQQLPASITDLDANRPVWAKAQFYADAFVGYRTRLWSDRVNAKFQLNVRNIQEHGKLLPVAAFPDGTPSVYRIVDPRQFILSASFEL